MFRCAVISTSAYVEGLGSIAAGDNSHFEVGVPSAVTALAERVVRSCGVLLLLRVYDELLLELLVRRSLLLQEPLPLLSVWRKVVQKDLQSNGPIESAFMTLKVQPALQRMSCSPGK